MNIYENPNDLKVRPYSRLENPTIFSQRHPGSFFRRPRFPLLRRRIMSGRYHNMGFRAFPPPLYRPDFPMPHRPPCDFRYRSPLPPNTATPFLPIQRSPFPGPHPNMFDGKSNEFPLTPRSVRKFNECQVSVDSSEQTNEPYKINTSSDVWIEANASRGRRYYYNYRTRETTWNKPINVRVISLDEAKHLRANSEMEKSESDENQTKIMQQSPINPYDSSFFPCNFSVPPRLIMYPPTQNVCNSAQFFFGSSLENVQGVTNCNYPTMVPSPVFTVPVIPENLIKTNDSNTNVTFIEVSSNSERTNFQPFNDNLLEFSNSVNKITYMNVSQSNVLLHTSNNFDTVNNAEEISEITMKQDTEQSPDIKPKNMTIQSFKLEDSAMAEVECMSTQNPVENKKYEQRTDKSRPISSTPVPGTCWYVVWTGDKKVFFFDSKRKVSVWERPAILLNRTDVDKLVEKSPLTVDDKPVKKEIRKTTSNHSDVIKKLKKDYVKSEDSDLEENSEIQITSLFESATNPEENSMVDDIPREQKVKMFFDMLTENNVSALSTWEKEVHKIVFDPRYLLFPTNERKEIFKNFVQKKLEEKKSERKKTFRCQREKFISLLEEAGVTSKSQFSDIARRYANDLRFKAIKKMDQKENIFNQHVSNLIKKDRENERLETEQKKKFIELLTEKKCLGKDWSEVQKSICNDERYKAIQSDSFKESIFSDFIWREWSNMQQNEKEKRISISIKKREEEVKRDLSIHLKKREREQEIHKYTSDVCNFKALLDDLINDCDLNWHSARKILKEDNRWDYTQDLEPEKREELFNEHIKFLNNRKKKQFHCLLDEIPGIKLKTSWLDIRKTVLKDSRCGKFSSSERACEKEFKDYLRKKLSSAKAEFKELLKETKLITHKSKSFLGCTNHLKEIENTLSQDKRYKNLDCMRSERKEILLSYIDKLHFDGPPPAASDTANRTKSVT